VLFRSDVDGGFVHVVVEHYNLIKSGTGH